MFAKTIFGRDVEFDQLRKRLVNRRSFLLHGPAGVGKTLLMKSLAADDSSVLYCSESFTSQAVFRCIGTELLRRRNPHLVAVCSKHSANLLNEKSAVSLRGIVSEALQLSHYSIVVDHIRQPSQSFAQSMKDLCSRTGTTLIAIARSAHMEDTGFLAPLFADRTERFELRNFDPQGAESFASVLAEQFALSVSNKIDVITKIVSFSKGNPGAIVSMMQMAASPKYVSQDNVKMSPLYLDFIMMGGVK